MGHERNKKKSGNFFYTEATDDMTQMREKRRRESEWRPTTEEAGCVSRVFLFVFVNYEIFFFFNLFSWDERRELLAAKRQAKERFGPAARSIYSYIGTH